MLSQAAALPAALPQPVTLVLQRPQLAPPCLRPTFAGRIVSCQGVDAPSSPQRREHGEGAVKSSDFAAIPAVLSRRATLSAALAGAAVPLITRQEPAQATQGMTAGRLPGLSEPDNNGEQLASSFLTDSIFSLHEALEQRIAAIHARGRQAVYRSSAIMYIVSDAGIRTYKRPEGKSGGHGVGWSEMIPYSFQVPEEWDEVPVSIADLGGTEIDLRFQNAKEGNLSITVAPVLRFSDRLGNNAKIEDIGTPDKVINAFGPELVGSNVEGKVKDMEVREVNGRKYYQYELETPHALVSATAAGNRLYIMTVTANGRQWKKHAPDLRDIATSFRVG
eukprot:SM000178S03456  [mRNA]  locus=s178:169574:171781:- [translate_table: standard]